MKRRGGSTDCKRTQEKKKNGKSVKLRWAQSEEETRGKRAGGKMKLGEKDTTMCKKRSRHPGKHVVREKRGIWKDRQKKNERMPTQGETAKVFVRPSREEKKPIRGGGRKGSYGRRSKRGDREEYREGRHRQKSLTKNNPRG